MYGVIFGDIAGSKFEGCGRTDEDAVLIKRGTGVSMPIEASFFTDDTVLSVAVADALLTAKSEGNLEDSGRVSELTEMCLRRYGLAYPAMNYGNRFFNWLYEYGAPANNSCGNGSAMRVSAAGMLASSKEEAEHLARAVTIPTHIHQEGIKGAVCTAVLTYMAGVGASKEEMCKEAGKYYDMRFKFYEKSISSYRAGIWVCQGTLLIAIRAFLESESYEDMIRKCVGFGGDTDTLAAIAGAFGGLYYRVPAECESYVRATLAMEQNNRLCPLLPIIDAFLEDEVVKSKMARPRPLKAEPFTKKVMSVTPVPSKQKGLFERLSTRIFLQK